MAPAGWLKALATASRAGTLAVPFVSIGADGTGSRLLVAILESRDEPKAHVTAFTARAGIEAVDCTVPDQVAFDLCPFALSVTPVALFFTSLRSAE